MLGLSVTRITDLDCTIDIRKHTKAHANCYEDRKQAKGFQAAEEGVEPRGHREHT